MSNRTIKNENSSLLREALQLGVRLAFTPLAKIYFAMVRGLVKSPPTIHRNRSECPCLAVKTSKLFTLHSIVIFVKYREVSTPTTMPNLSAAFVF